MGPGSGENLYDQMGATLVHSCMACCAARDKNLGNKVLACKPEVSENLQVLQ